MTLSNARTRLEGRLEALERACTQLELAVPNLKGGRLNHVNVTLEQVQGPEVRTAVESVRAMLSQEPALSPLLERLNRANVKLTNEVRQLAKARGISAMPVEEQVKALLVLPALYDERLANPIRWFQALFALVWLGILNLVVVGSHHWELLPATLLAGVGVGAWIFRSKRFVVTREAIVVNGRAYALRELEAVLFRGSIVRKAQGGSLVLRLRVGSISFRVPAMPDDLLNVLRAQGVVVELRER